uniref:Actin interacting protein 3-like C-terminal domain-containing protein n=1 Tax=Romanomermis culicivorax TaxID=13658 RepID=A0A915JFD5_ROMCU
MGTYSATILRSSHVYAATSDGVKNLEKWDDDDELVRFAIDDSVSSRDKSNRNVLNNARLMLNRAKLEVRHRWASISSNLNKAIVKTRQYSFLKGPASNEIVEENGNAEDSGIEETNSSHSTKDNAKPCLKLSNTLDGSNAKTSSKHKRRTTFAPMGQKSNTLDYKSTNSKKNGRFSLRNTNQQSRKHIDKIDFSNDKGDNDKEIEQINGDETTDDHRDFGYMDDDPGIMSESETSATRNASGRNKITKLANKDSNSKLPSSTSTNDIRREKDVAKSLGLAFLHYQGETKRILLPNEICSLTDVKQLFAKAFRGSLTVGYLQSPFVKIYIQDPTRQDVYYELDDLNEIRDRTVLKLHEQPRPTSPSAAANTFCSITDHAQSNQPSVFLPINKCNNDSNPDYGMLDGLRPQDPKQDQKENDSPTTFITKVENQKFSSSVANDVIPIAKNCCGERSPRSLMSGHGERIRYSSVEPPAKPYRCFGGAKLSMGQYNRRRSRSPPNGLGVQ